MGFFRRISALGRRSKLNSEIEDEFREHLQMRIDDNLAKGMSPTEAAREARLRFGNPTVMRERVDAEDTAAGLDSFFRDARYAVRGFTKSRAFTAMAILTLALGIGANTAVFQLVDARAPAQPAHPESAGTGRVAHRRRERGIRHHRRPVCQLHHPHVAGGSTPSRSILRRLRLARGRRAGRKQSK